MKIKIVNKMLKFIAVIVSLNLLHGIRGAPQQNVDLNKDVDIGDQAVNGDNKAAVDYV
jgi:hypothetical protein